MRRLHGCSTVMALVCAAGAACAAPHPLQGPYRDGNRILASRPAMAEGVVNDVRAPGANGKLWVGRGYIGDPDGKFAKDYPLAWGSPGPAGYGAYEDDFSQVHVRVGETSVEINPWESIPEAGYQHLERGRQAWLKENGFTGGVRTFTNPVYRRSGAPAVASAEPAPLPQPRMIIDLPPDMPRFKKRQEVNAQPRSYESTVKPGTIVVVRSNTQPAVTPVIDAKSATQVTVRPAADSTGKDAPAVKVAEASEAPATETTPS